MQYPRKCKQFKLTVFVFRRDLRITDNTALNQALLESQQVLPCFIFDPKQIETHPYQSKPGLRFLLNSLQDLSHQLSAIGAKLHFFYGSPTDIVTHLYQALEFEALFVNRDYSPYARQRDYNLYQHCQHLGINFQHYADALLLEPEQALKSDGKPYTVFTPFFRNASRFQVAPSYTATSKAQSTDWYTQKFDTDVLGQARAQNILAAPPKDYNEPKDCNEPKDYSEIGGGSDEASGILRKLGEYSNYSEERDVLAHDATTHLSSHLKFGTCSVREAYHSMQFHLDDHHPLQRQLYWRDFFTHIGYHFDHVFGRAFRPKYDRMQWRQDKTLFERWCEGTTGFPVVDAGMRELVATGYMHNRARMITASFLCKDLRLPWQWGEQFFARYLVDYDPCVNNGNWQWAASTGCDAQPYFRIFNPWRQQQRFDKQCLYIKRWIPELAALSPKQIHKLEHEQGTEKYPAPLVSHSQEAQETKRQFKLCLDACTLSDVSNKSE